MESEGCVGFFTPFVQNKVFLRIFQGRASVDREGVNTLKGEWSLIRNLNSIFIFLYEYLECNHHLIRVLVCWGCHNKVPRTEWLKQQKFIVSLFWRLKV